MERRRDLTKWSRSYHSFHSNLLGKQLILRSNLNMEAISKGPVLTIEQQLKLCSRFTHQEIKNAMFSIPNVKSLGPNG